MIMNIEKITDDNFFVFCARHYDKQCHSTEEFIEDLQRIKYIKKLITRYEETSELKERLILNHLIILANVFGPDIACKIIFLKMRDQLKYLKPFMILLNMLPSRLYNVGEEKIINTDLIPMDNKIVEALRKI
jgi:hypothetical protein